MKVSLQELEEKVRAGVSQLGYSGEEAEIISDVLLYAEMRGNNQGISKIATGGVPHASEVEEYQITRENKCGVLTSGGHSMVASSKAADHAVRLAAEHGVGVACTNHTETSSGSIGYYARQVSQAGYICFMTVGNGDFAAVAPFGSSEAKMGTNPFAYAFPYDGGEVVFDCATAAIAYFGAVQAMLSGEPMPEGVAVDVEGNMTTNPHDVIDDGDGEGMKGAITTFAGYKGFGLSLFVQLLGSAFAMAGTVGAHEEDGAGTCIIAIDPGLLSSSDEYMKRAREVVDSVRSARPIPGMSVVLPGERGDTRVAQVQESGEIDIADGVWNKLCEFIEE